MDLITRVTTALTPSLRADRNYPVGTSGQTAVSLVDVPTNAPDGTWGLEVLVDDGTSLTPFPAEYQIKSQITILDSQGASTPLDGWFGESVFDLSDYMQHVVPRPGVVLSPASTCPAPPCAGGPMATVEFEVEYLPAVIDVADVVPVQFGSDLIIWFEDDDQNGIVHVSAIAPSGGVGQLLLLFTLDDGASQILDLGTDISIDPGQVQAHDADGIDLTAEWDVSVTATGIM